MEEILIPVECLYDIPSLNHMSMPSYKKGDIFMLNPDHEVHIELQEHGVFKEIDNNLCEFICKYPSLVINKKTYEVNDKILKKDIDSFETETLKNLYYIGYIEKRLINKKKSNKKVSKNKTTKNKVAETYTMLAKKYGISTPDFKKTILEQAGIEIKDMRKKVPLKEKKIIIGVLNK